MLHQEDRHYQMIFSPSITNKQFSLYFENRANYKLENDEASYDNEDTGVNFKFTFLENSVKAVNGNVVFTIDLICPHYFAVEADIELSYFVERFKCRMIVPTRRKDQIPKDGFILDWNHRNESSYATALKTILKDDVMPSRPTEELAAIWKWNFSRDYLTDHLIKNDVFMPMIQFNDIAGSLQSVVVWPAHIRTIIPVVDSVVILRQHNNPTSRCSFIMDNTSYEICIATYSEARSVLEPYSKMDGNVMTSVSSLSDTVPASVLNFANSLMPVTGKIGRVKMQCVLDKELVEKHGDNNRSKI